MRVARNIGAAAADEEVQIGAQMRLLHMLHIKFVPAALRYGRRPPLAFTSREFLIGHVQMKAAGGHVELDEVPVAHQRQRTTLGSLRRGDETQALIISAKGTTLSDCSPLTFIVGDSSYEASITLEIGDSVQAGIALFYSERMFCGVGFSNQQMFTYNYGQEHRWMREDLRTRTVRLKV